MRIAACHMLADIYGRLNSEKRTIARKKYAKLAKDDTPMVRLGLAQSIQVLAVNLEPELIAEFLLPILKVLMNDKIDSVKVHSVQSSVIVAKLVQDPQLIVTDILP